MNSLGYLDRWFVLFGVSEEEIRDKTRTAQRGYNSFTGLIGLAQLGFGMPRVAADSKAHQQGWRISNKTLWGRRQVTSDGSPAYDQQGSGRRNRSWQHLSQGGWSW